MLRVFFGLLLCYSSFCFAYKETPVDYFSFDSKPGHYIDEHGYVYQGNGYLNSEAWRKHHYFKHHRPHDRHQGGRHEHRHHQHH